VAVVICIIAIAAALALKKQPATPPQ
jgi:hypothetical protein